MTKYDETVAFQAGMHAAHLISGKRMNNYAVGTAEYDAWCRGYEKEWAYIALQFQLWKDDRATTKDLTGRGTL